jgi:hypothetical protein
MIDVQRDRDGYTAKVSDGSSITAKGKTEAEARGKADDLARRERAERLDRGERL